jgi:predicted MFS family arabinose efflux permease
MYFLNALVINFIFFILKNRDLNSLRSFGGGFFLWLVLAFVWKLIDGRQMPQLAILLCIVGLATHLGLSMSGKIGKDFDKRGEAMIFSQIFTLVIMLVASFFMFSNVRWI